MKKKILIIEDDNSIRRVVKDILQKENLYEVYEAFDGKDGVKKIIDGKSIENIVVNSKICHNNCPNSKHRNRIKDKFTS